MENGEFSGAVRLGALSCLADHHRLPAFSTTAGDSVSHEFRL